MQGIMCMQITRQLWHLACGHCCTAWPLSDATGSGCPSLPAHGAQGILSTGVITAAGVLYVTASTKNADSSVSWVRCCSPPVSL